MRPYIVIVYPPRPTAADARNVGTTPVATPPRVVNVQARTAEEAADQAQVAPGGYCHVVVDARTFQRAEEAPLVERQNNLSPLPVAADAA